MRILCITDKLYTESETALKGIFENHILKYCECYMVYFTKDSKEAISNDTKLIFPYSTKHRNFVRTLLRLNYNLNDFDLIIVRNFYKVAKQILSFSQKIVFWETFPHDYRRIYEAKRDKKSVIRKSIEYKIKHYIHKKILEKCLAYMGSTPHFKNVFYNSLQIPTSYIPNGIDFSLCNLKLIEKNIQQINTPLKLLYIGSIDKNRQVLEIIEAINEVNGDFILDIFSPSNNSEVDNIKEITKQNNKIRLNKSIPFNEIFNILPKYDIGIGIIPNTPLYSVSSPIKVMEYASNGVIPLINDLPEYTRLFDDNNAFFTTFDKRQITNTIESIIKMNQNKLIEKKQNLLKLAKEKLDYQNITKEVYDFFLTLK